MMDANQVKGYAESHEYDTKDRQGTSESNEENFYRSQQKDKNVERKE